MELSQYKEDFNKITDYLKEELAGLRTGRANAAMVENILVDAYGNKMALKGVASINIPDARNIIIDPWDKTLIKEVESAIRNAGKGLNPVNEGEFLRVGISALTEESRKDLVKLISEKAEAARIKIRQLRDKIKDEILRQEEAKEITEDQRYKLQQDLDKKCSDFNDKIKEIATDKEKEVMTV